MITSGPTEEGFGSAICCDNHAAPLHVIDPHLLLFRCGFSAAAASFFLRFGASARSPASSLRLSGEASTTKKVTAVVRAEKPATSRSEDERCAHLLRRSFRFSASLTRCLAVRGRPHFLSRARPSVLSSGLHMRDIVNFGSAAAYRSDEPHVSGAMSNTRFFDPMK